MRPVRPLVCRRCVFQEAAVRLAAPCTINMTDYTREYFFNLVSEFYSPKNTESKRSNQGVEYQQVEAAECQTL